MPIYYYLFCDFATNFSVNIKSVTYFATDLKTPRIFAQIANRHEFLHDCQNAANFLGKFQNATNFKCNNVPFLSQLFPRNGFPTFIVVFRYL